MTPRHHVCEGCRYTQPPTRPGQWHLCSRPEAKGIFAVSLWIQTKGACREERVPDITPDLATQGHKP